MLIVIINNNNNIIVKRISKKIKRLKDNKKVKIFKN